MPSTSSLRRSFCIALTVVGIFTSGVVRAANTDIEGHAVSLDGKVAAVVFLGTECPISRSEIAPLNKIAADASEASVFGVISDPTGAS